jgi:hypothetical protein
MSSDPQDELARRRAAQHRDRKGSGQEAADDVGRSADQEAAIARARESWFLSQVGRDEADAADSN